MKQRFAAIWIICSSLSVGAGGGVLLILNGALADPHRAALQAILAANTPLLVIVAIFACAISFLFAQWIVQTYFKPLQRYADITRLIAGSNSAYRIDGGGPPELQSLATAINALAATHETLLRETSARIHEAQLSVATERSHLATLMSELAQSVVVCNAEGRILLYNEKARQLFSIGHTPAVDPAPAFFGLGRLIYALADRDAIVAGHDELRRRSALNELRPVAEFEMRLANGKIARTRMALARHQASSSSAPTVETDGFVLLLTAINADDEAPLTQRREALIPSARPVYYDFDLFHQAGQTQVIDDRQLSMLTYSAFDTETTGLDPSAGDEIIAIGAVRIVNGRLLQQEQYAQLIDPRRSLHPQSIAIHGLSADRLHGQPTIDQALPAFFRFCEDTVLLGHNAAFDMRFLELKQQATGICFNQPVLDTLLLSAALHGTLHEHSLEAIAMRLGVTIVDRHTAIGDAITTAQVFLKLLPLLAQRGIVTLKQAREASAGTSYARIRY